MNESFQRLADRRLSLLLVDDEPLMQRALSGMLQRYGDCTPALSAAAARSHFAQSWDGIVLDVSLGDGSGHELLEDLRRRNVRTPAAIVAGTVDGTLINRSLNLDAWLISKPCGVAELSGFVEEVLQRGTGNKLYATTERARCLWQLSDRETQVIRLALEGKGRAAHLAETHVSENTYKTQVRRLLRKTGGFRNLAELAAYLKG